jgi:hypothetical protein
MLDNSTQKNDSQQKPDPQDDPLGNFQWWLQQPCPADHAGQMAAAAEALTDAKLADAAMLKIGACRPIAEEQREKDFLAAPFDDSDFDFLFPTIEPLDGGTE